MPNLTLPSGQVISSQDPNYAEYVKTYGAPVDNTSTTSTSSVTPSLSLADAQTQAGTVLGTNSGLVSPMSLADIRSQQESATLASKQSAEAQFNPQISRTERAGAIELGSAVGSTGQRQGFNLSSGESMYLSAVQDSVNKRISEVENQMAAAINQGRVDAAEKAQASIDKLNEYNNNLIMKRADIAMNLVTQNQQQQQIDIQKAGQEFDQDMASKNLALSVAQLTGEYEGSPTFAANQAKIENALAEANITGYYNNTKTLEAVTSEAQQKLQQQGINIQKDQLAETIRSNRAQEGLASARLAADKKTTQKLTPTDAANQAVSRLVNLRNSGSLNDANYWAEVNTLGSAIGFDMTDEVQRKRMDEMVLKSMNGDQSSKDWIANQGNQAMGSDFIISSPASTDKIKSVADVLSKAKSGTYVPGAGAQANQAKADKIIGDLTLNMSATDRANLITQAQKLVK